MDTVKEATKVIKAGLALLDKKDQDGLKTRGLTADEIIGNASGMVNKSPAREALLKVWAIQEANRIASFVWRKGLMTSELEAEFRALPDMDEAAKDWQQYIAERKVVADELESQRKAYADTEKEMDLFKGILNGMSKEEAEKEYENYRKQMEQALQQQG